MSLLGLKQLSSIVIFIRLYIIAKWQGLFPFLLSVVVRLEIRPLSAILRLGPI